MSDTTTCPVFNNGWTKGLEIPEQQTRRYILLADKNSNDVIIIDSNQGSMIAMLRDYYNMDGEHDIRAFLDGNDNLVPLLYDIHKRIQKYFPNSPLSMRAIQNDLIISVGTMLNPEDAIDSLDRFDDEWWLDKLLALESNKGIYIRVEYL